MNLAFGAVCRAIFGPLPYYAVVIIVEIGKKFKGERKKERRKIMPLIVATYVRHAARLQRRTGSARTSLGPIIITTLLPTYYSASQ